VVTWNKDEEQCRSSCCTWCLHHEFQVMVTFLKIGSLPTAAGRWLNVTFGLLPFCPVISPFSGQNIPLDMMMGGHQSRGQKLGLWSVFNRRSWEIFTEDVRWPAVVWTDVWRIKWKTGDQLTGQGSNQAKGRFRVRIRMRVSLSNGEDLGRGREVRVNGLKYKCRVVKVQNHGKVFKKPTFSPTFFSLHSMQQL
jgi:hypothetical protein